AFERDQEKSLAGEGRDGGELLLSREHAFAGGGGAVDSQRVPDFRGYAIEVKPWPPGVFDQGAIRGQVFQGVGDIGVSGPASSPHSPSGLWHSGEKMVCIGLPQRTNWARNPPVQWLSLRGKNRLAGKKFHDTERTVLRHVMLR